MKKEVLGLVIVVLVAMGLGVGYLAGNSVRQTETITSTSTLVRASTVTSQLTVTSNTTVEKTVTSVVTSNVLEGQPIPVASVETGNISIGESPGEIAVNPNDSRIYVEDGSSLLVINASSHSLMTTVALPGSSDGIAIDYGTNTVYVSTQSEVAEINGTSNKVVGGLPFVLAFLAFDERTDVLYGSLTLGVGPPPAAARGYVLAIDARTGSEVANVTLGFDVLGIALDPYTDMVYAVGCAQQGLACDSQLAIVNGTSRTLVTTVPTSSAYYSTMTMNARTNVVYVSGGEELLALNGTNGQEIFHANPETCGPFLDMAVNAVSDQVLVVPQNYNYLLVYDGTSGALVNMYSFSGSPLSVAFNPNTDELYMTLPRELLIFRNVAGTGNVNSTMIGSYQTCLPV